jgi:hypothetical protein
MKNFKGLNNNRYYLYRPIVIIIILTIIISFIVGYDTSLERIIDIAFVVFIWGVICSILPMLILFINYSNENKNSSLIINNGYFEFSKNKQLIKFSASDIKEVELNLSLNLYYNELTLFLWDEYYYTVIKLKNGENCIITCLLCNELEKHIPNQLIKRKRRIFATTFTI